MTWGWKRPISTSRVLACSRLPSTFSANWNGDHLPPQEKQWATPSSWCRWKASLDWQAMHGPTRSCPSRVRIVRPRRAASVAPAPLGGSGAVLTAEPPICCAVGILPRPMPSIRQRATMSARPIRTGWGIKPHESHVRHVRKDRPHIRAACLAVTKSRWSSVEFCSLSCSGSRICDVSILLSSFFQQQLDCQERRAALYLPVIGSLSW